MDGLTDALNDALAQFSADLMGQLRDMLTQTMSTWFEHSGPGIFGRLLSMAFGAMAQWLWYAAGGALGSFNIFTQLPPMWSYELQPVVDLRSRLGPVAGGVMALALVGGLAWGVICLTTGKPFSRVVGMLPTFLLCTGGLLVAPTICKWWIDFANAASATLLDPRVGLPGLDAVKGWEYTSALGVVAVVYLVVALLLLLSRLKLVVIVALLLVVAPIALASMALPFSLAQRFFHWWLATLTGAVFVQVLQAVCLGMGAALLAAPFIAGGVEGPAEGVLSASIGIGSIIAAMSLPGMLLGSLARANLAPGMMGTALQAGVMLAGFGFLPGMAGAAAAAPARAFLYPATPLLPAGSAAAGASSSYVRSILAASPTPPRLMLPPPKP